MSERPPASQRKGVGESLAFDFTPRSPPKEPEREPPSREPPSREPPSREPASREPPVPKAPVPKTPAPKPEPRVFTVGELGRLFGRVLERTFPETLWVEGEVTGARLAPSGHAYFALKDEEDEATLDVVVYRSSLTPRGRALVKDGARLRVRARPMFWAPRGRLQLIGDRIEPTGKGALLEALEKLKEKLAAEGLFAPERKRPLPHDPRVVGVVTSSAGAAIHDVCRVAFRRGGARLLLANAQVQGAGAAESIRRALHALERIEEVDVIIVGRGGGSQDDLLAFNDEHLVRDVAACRVPVVSAVGHEVDVSLVDFAADARAATPSQAAEMVVPDAASRRRLLGERSERLRRAIHARVTEGRVTAGRLQRAFSDPRLLIASAQQRVDESVARMQRIVSRRMAAERDLAVRLESRLAAAHPRERIARDRVTLAALEGRLRDAARTRLAAERGELGAVAARLGAMSPLAVLARGYAIATTKDGRAVRDARELGAGARVEVRVARGTFEAEVISSGDADEREP